MDYSTVTGIEQEAIRELILSIQDSFRIAKVVLFGSKVRHQATEYSDVNLIVLTKLKRTKEDREKLSDITAEINIKYGVGLSCLYYNADDWKRGEGVNPSLKENVDKEGILLDI